MQQKIKVVFLPPIGQQVPEEDEQPSSILNDSVSSSSRLSPDVCVALTLLMNCSWE